MTSWQDVEEIVVFSGRRRKLLRVHQTGIQADPRPGTRSIGPWRVARIQVDPEGERPAQVELAPEGKAVAGRIVHPDQIRGASIPSPRKAPSRRTRHSPERVRL